MTPEPKLFGRPVARIVALKCGFTVGYLYEWNNGEREPAWIGRPVKHVRHEPITAEIATEI